MALAIILRHFDDRGLIQATVIPNAGDAGGGYTIEAETETALWQRLPPRSSFTVAAAQTGADGYETVVILVRSDLPDPESDAP